MAMEPMDQYRNVLEAMFGEYPDYRIEDYVHVFTEPRQLFLAFKVFFPDIEVVGGEPVLGPLTDEQKEEIARILSDGAEVQKLSSYRWLEVPYLFADRSALSDDQDRILAKLMLETWHAKLVQQFPGRNWEVRILEPSETGSVVGIEFLEVP